MEWVGWRKGVASCRQGRERSERDSKEKRETLSPSPAKWQVWARVGVGQGMGLRLGVEDVMFGVDGG